MAEFYSTIENFQQFTNSNMWRDMSGEMEAWLEDIRTQLETCSDGQVISRLQGNAEAVHRFLELPQVITDLLIIDAEAYKNG